MSHPSAGVGAYEVTSVHDLRTLAGPNCTLGDAAVLWRLLRETGRLRKEEGHTVILVSGPEEMAAWVVRARVAARRERSALAQHLRPE